MYFPDLPGCEFSASKLFKLTEIMQAAVNLLGSHLYKLELADQEIPAPTPLSKFTPHSGTGVYIPVSMSKFRNGELKVIESHEIETMLAKEAESRKQASVLNIKSAETMQRKPYAARQSTAQPQRRNDIKLDAIDILIATVVILVVLQSGLF